MQATSTVGVRKGLMGMPMNHRPAASQCDLQAKCPVAVRRTDFPVIRSAQQQGTASSDGHSSGPSSTRRAALVGALAATVACPFAGAPLPAAARGSSFKSAGGIEYRDIVVGNGGETFDGDTIRITFTAHTFDTETGEKLRTFDPFINGGGGSSMTKGFKLTLGGSNGDVPAGLNLGIVGGDGVVPMQKGGKRLLRIPPELAYGEAGHHCYLAMKDQCEVPPNTPVEIEVEFLGFV